MPMDFSKLSVTRNGVTLVAKKGTFGKKSPHSGKEFPNLEFSVANAAECLKWFGQEELIGVAANHIRKIAQGEYLDILTDNNGTFLPEVWIAAMADFSAGFQKLSDIEEELDGLQATQMSIALDENFGAKEFVLDEQGNKIADPTTAEDETPFAGFKSRFTNEAERLSGEVQKINAKIKPLRQLKAQIEAHYAARAAKRAAAKEAKEEATKVAA